MQRNGSFGKAVLCAIDLAHSWHAVLSQAAQFAQSRELPLIVLHVTDPPGNAVARLFAAEDLAQRSEQHRAELEAELAAETRRFLDHEFPAVQSEVLVREGSSAAVIRACAEERKAGLIVVGTREWDGWDRLFVGSTADRLMRTSKVPVLIAGPHLQKPVRRILVPTDLDRPDEGAIRIACSVALAFKSRVSLLHVYAQPSLQHRYLGNVAALRAAAKADATARFGSFVSGLSLPEGAKIAHKLLKASTDETRPADRIIEACDKLSIDLIVMALSGHSSLKTVVIGSVAERVIRNLPCPMLALPTRFAEAH